ncbi:hypothetical protein E0H73_07925 [Kribbella pittospori]|uniref:DUF6571 domain-containing protein n=1 Tax=Kribbella pittospori TaxID=722689 RepID=A0A4R0L0N7_9ACTN|nr:hypothetical protein [Kribbella pittospori]TCC64328.1 hypothetical protein E0H73_07925 [Kribbella pittospori]
MADIKIDINKLDSALKKLDTLVSSTDSQRKSASSNTPISLPSLEDGELGKTTKWLTEQKPELQTRLDLARLLDVDGDGQASYKVEYGDQLWEVKRGLSDEMTKQLKDLDVNSVDDRKRAALLASLLNRYQNDPDIPWQVMNGLGPEGVTEVMNKLRNMTGQYGSTYWQNSGDAGAEHTALIDLQEQMGKGLAGMFSSASVYMDGDWGKKIAEDPWSASVLMRYVDKAHKDIDPMVFEAMGTELKDREHNDPMIWSQIFNDPDYWNFGNEHFSNLNPMREYLNVADNSTRDAQAVMGNKDLMHYFTSERQDYDHLSDQAGKVLKVATVDAAYSDNYQYAMSAAEISSNLLHDLGGKSEPLDGVKEEVGGIVATYITDAARVHDKGGDSTQGYHLWGDKDHPYPYGLGKESGLPTYGINLSQADLRGVLEDVGDNDAAKSAVGKATSILNAARFDYAAAHHKDDPTGMHKVAHEASTLNGFMTDSLVNGNIDSEKEAAEERKKVAEFFTSPIDLIPTDKVPVIGDFIKGEVTDALVEGYTADKTSDAIDKANEAQGKSISLTQLQALYAMEQHDLPTGADWPTENGHPKPPEKLSEPEVQRVLANADTQTGLTSDVTGEVENAWDVYMKKYGDN